MTRQTAPSAQAEHRKLSQHAADAIRDWIIAGEFEPGRKLLESDLVGRLGMSKSPIREALLQLEREGLVVMAPNRSARVFSMGPGEISELGELRQMLELQALRLAAERNPDALVAALADVVSRMVEALGEGNTDSYKLLDNDFHHVIFTHCGNSYLDSTFRMLSFRVQTLRNRLSRDEALNRQSLQDHQDILAALREGQVDAAHEILARHVAQTAVSYLAHLEADAAADATPEQGASRVDCAEMERFARAALGAVGADAETADAVVKALMHASLHGVDTHGFRLLPHYLNVMQGGRVKPAPKLSLSAGKGGAAVLDAGDGHGARAGYAAVDHAVELARIHGVGAVAIRRSSHFGAAGAYAIEIARNGMMGLAFCNSDAFVRLHDGAERFHGTNPIAAAAPTGGLNPWLLDMATSSIPFNRVKLNRSLGLPLPDQTASDMAGLDTTDPDSADMLAPLGGAMFGYKGAGLGGLAEILSSALSDAPLSIELPSMTSDEISTPRELGAFVMAIDPEAFAGLAVFEAVMQRYLGRIHGSAAVQGGHVMAPGDREWAEAARRRTVGIRLDPVSTMALAEFAATHGLTPLNCAPEVA